MFRRWDDTKLHLYATYSETFTLFKNVTLAKEIVLLVYDVCFFQVFIDIFMNSLYF